MAKRVKGSLPTKAGAIARVQSGPRNLRGSPRLRRDVMSAEKRSSLMSRIRGKGTGPERFLASELARWRFAWESHVADLPGRPDFVFRRRRVVIFVDGDFWHGWRFSTWSAKLAPFWFEKISDNRQRDRRNHSRLRRIGWTVIRVWEHELERRPNAAVRRIVNTLRTAHRIDRPALGSRIDVRGL